MSYPILQKLSEHLKIVEQWKQNIPQFVFAAILYMEEARVYNPQMDEKRMITSYLQFINAATDHDGDCVKASAPCILCHALDSIGLAQETLDEGTSIYKEMNDEERILRLIEVLLATLPKNKFNSEVCLRNSRYRYGEIFDHEYDIVKRIEMWESKDEKEKQEIKKMVKDLLLFTKLELEA